MTNRKIVKSAGRFYLEAGLWIIALIILFTNNPADSSHFTLCPLKNLNFGFCPGCGLGSSITWLFKGEIIRSLHTHPLSIPVLFLLIMRIYQLIVHSRFVIKHLNKV